MAVQHGRHLVRATDPAGSALAELGTQFGDELYLGHERTLLGTNVKISIKTQRGRRSSFDLVDHGSATLAEATAQP